VFRVVPALAYRQRQELDSVELEKRREAQTAHDDAVARVEAAGGDPASVEEPTPPPPTAAELLLRARVAAEAKANTDAVTGLAEGLGVETVKCVRR
jgi:hypothetical protein